MKYFFIAGEPSGSQICASIIKQLMLIDLHAKVYAMGDQSIGSVGAKLLIDIGNKGVMGFTGVMRSIGYYQRLKTQLKSHIREVDPDVLIFCDFAGFNLPICQWAKDQGYKTTYIAPPKTWASRSYRNRILKKATDNIIVLYPFEQEYFKYQGINTQFYGHPVVSSEMDTIRSKAVKSKTILIAPGSRSQEIKHILPIILSAIHRFDDYQFIISKAPNIKSGAFNEYLATIDQRRYRISEESLIQLLPIVDLAIITSGTATFEAALANTPQIVVYKTNRVNYWIAKRLIRSAFISLPNLIMNRSVVPELIQGELYEDNLIAEIHKLLQEDEAQISAYAEIQSVYKRHDSCAEKISKAIIDLAK